MEKETAAVVAQLADRLGTTSEYLWAVLIKQAPITGTVILIEYAVTALAVVLVWRNRKSLMSAWTTGVDSGDGVAFVTIMGFLIFGVVAIVWLLACLFNLGTVVSAFFNPEYFALDKVVSTLKSK